MSAAFAQTGRIAVLVFAVTSMLSVGLAYSVRSILGPLRELRAVFRALVANFVLVPLVAVGVERVIPIDPPLALGLFLVAGAAGAPFLIKLTKVARRDLALSAALLLLLLPANVVFLPFYVPVAMAHPSMSGLTYEPTSIFALGLPLVSTMILPLVVGLIVKAVSSRWAARLVGPLGKLATVALLVVVVAILVANVHEVVEIVKTGAIAAALLLVLGAFVAGFLLARRERATVLGLGTAQRNIAAAMVVASQSFRDPDILVMVTVSSLVALIVLFPIAWLMSKRPPTIGPPSEPPRRSVSSEIPQPA